MDRIRFLLAFGLEWLIWSFVCFVLWFIGATWIGFVWVSWLPVFTLVAVPACMLGLGLTVYCTSAGGRRAAA